MLEEEKHLKYTGVSNRQILENFESLIKAGARVWVRIPVIPEINGGEAQMHELACYLKRAGAVKVSLLPYHKTGSSKYEKLGIPYPGAVFSEPDKEAMENVQAIFLEWGLADVKIGG